MKKKQLVSWLKSTVLLSLILVAGCTRQAGDVNTSNLVEAKPSTRTTIGDANHQFLALGYQAFQRGLAEETFLAAGSSGSQAFLGELADESDLPDSTDVLPPASDPDNSLVVGYPVELLGEQQIFGGVITAVDDTQDTSIGDLKLTDLNPLHVQAEVARASNGYELVLVGCTSKCTEASATTPLVAIPIVGMDANEQNVLLDLSSLGQELNLIQLLDPKGSTLQLKTVSSKTVSLDYSLSTLVFDVQTTVTPTGTASGATVKGNIAFTVRWYLRLASAFNPAFEPRDATPGVGFFMTERSATPKIERQSIPVGPSSDGPVKYYIKNVPTEFQPGFSDAFDEWNQEFQQLVGHNIFSYEFIDSTDPRAKELVTGDPRYHIVEWDLVNEASYGGLGPSIANQFTGEILTSNVLVQGPTIISMYTEWFQASEQANEALAQNDDLDAQRILASASAVLAATQPKASPRMKLILGKNLAFRVTAQTPALEDPGVQRMEFEPIPTGYNFDSYMRGYFHDMVAHELGHNLGLRHNFHGSLDATDVTKVGGATDSIMEYLGREFRQLDIIGSYDRMAIKYGYLGTLPARTDIYCTDEDVPTKDNLGLSAECSPDDATTDPYAYFEGLWKHAADLLVARDATSAPDWTEAEMDSDLTPVINGLAMYAATAPKTASTWKHFFNTRPQITADGVKAYVLATFKAQLCPSDLDAVLAQKESDGARAKTQASLQALQTKVWTVVQPLGVFTADDLRCGD